MAQMKLFKRKELAERNNKKEVLFVIYNQVYDVTKFLEDHPGGHEILVEVAGKEASERFEEVAHSPDAKEMMKKYHIGEVVDEDKIAYIKQKASGGVSGDSSTSNSFFTSWKFSVALGLLMAVLYSYVFG